MLTIQWLDPRTDDSDEPSWGIWDTECGCYRITFAAERGTYVPFHRKHALVSATLRSVTDTPICEAGYATLEAAQDAVNQYHCDTHNLVPA